MVDFRALLDGRTVNAAVAWVATLALAVAALVLLADGAVLWPAFALLVVGVVLIPPIVTRDASATLPGELVALVAVPVALRALDLFVQATPFATMAGLALLVVLVLDAFTSLEMAPRFAVLFVVVTTMAFAGVWAMVEYASDFVLGTTFIEDQRELNLDLLSATLVGLLAGVVFGAYFRETDGDEPFGRRSLPRALRNRTPIAAGTASENQTAPKPTRPDDEPRTTVDVEEPRTTDEAEEGEMADEAGTTELLFSGIAAGFAIVLTFVGHAVGSAVFPNNGFLAAILYPLGFVYIIVGRYQLYTENTLPPVALVLTRLASLPLLLRVWGIVLFANVVGAGLGAFILANSHVLSTAAMHAGAEFTRSGLEHAWWDVFLKALFAGWLVAGVVWLGTAAQDTIARLLLIYSVFYMIAAAELYHVVTAAADALFFVFLDVPSPGLLVVFYDFWLPVLLGNTVGGVFLVALVNYGQTEQRRFPEVRELSAREVLFSWKGGRSHTTPRPYVEENEPGTD